LSWHTIHEYAEATETWTTIVVNLTGILTGLIVGGRWLVRRVEPNVRTVLQTAFFSLILSIAFAVVMVWTLAVHSGGFGG
jgi:hypothetical protein